MGRDKDLNRAIDSCESRPKRISLSMSTNSEEYSAYKKLDLSEFLFLTLIFLSKDFIQIKCTFDSLVPELSFKSKFDLTGTLPDGG